MVGVVGWFMTIIGVVLGAREALMDDYGEFLPHIRLAKDLMDPRRYDSRVRPVMNHSKPTTVSFSMSLHQILSINEKQQNVDLNVWAIQKWNDDFLGWNPYLYGMINTTILPFDAIWLPDTYLYNRFRFACPRKIRIKYSAEKVVYTSHGDCGLVYTLPPEQADDHNPLPLDFHVEDNFPYSEISKLLTPSECRILRSEFDTKERDIFVKELEARVKLLWPNSSFSSVSCGSHVRESKCERAIVFSSEANDCGEWLGKWFTGCVIVFCDHKHVLA